MALVIRRFKFLRCIQPYTYICRYRHIYCKTFKCQRIATIWGSLGLNARLLFLQCLEERVEVRHFRVLQSVQQSRRHEGDTRVGHACDLVAGEAHRRPQRQSCNIEHCRPGVTSDVTASAGIAAGIRADLQRNPSPRSCLTTEPLVIPYVRSHFQTR